MLSRYEKDISKFKTLPPEEELELFRKYRTGDMQAKDTLITSQLKLILHMCGGFKSDTDYEELVSNCNTALVLKFDKFHPYRKASKLTGNPKKAKNYSRGRLCYFTKQIVMSTIDAFLDHRKRTYGLVDADGVRLHIPLTDGEDVPNQEDPEDPKKESIDRLLDILLSRKKKILSSREKKILAGVFGLKCEKCTLKDLGLRFGITPMGVWHRKKKGIEKLRRVFGVDPGKVIKKYKRKDK